MTTGLESGEIPPAEVPARLPAGCRRWLELIFGGGICLVYLALVGTAWVGSRPDEARVLGGALLVGVAALAFMLARFVNQGRAAGAGSAGTSPGPEGSAEPAASPAGVDLVALPEGPSPRSHRVSRPGPHVLAITPTWERAIAAVLIFAFAGAFLVPAMEEGDWAWAIVTLVIGLVGLAVLRSGKAHRFDRREGVYRVTAPACRASEIPLRSILGVQVVAGIPREEPARYGGEPRRYLADQLNLILDAAKEPRRNLLEGSNPAAILEIGRLLAGFLGVPLYRDPAP